MKAVWDLMHISSHTNKPAGNRISMIDVPIILLGGTGDVGQRLARRLRFTTETRIILCSRRPKRASSWAPPISVEFLRVDTSNATHAAQLPSPAVVVNLTESTSAAFIATCLNRGMTFFDTSASVSYLRGLEEVGKSAKHGSVVPQVGLMPGLTNLLADTIVRKTPGICAIRVFAELSLGRHYGRAATVWTLHSIGSIAVHKRRWVTFPGKTKQVIALSFPFSDSIAIKEEASLDWAESFLAFSPSAITRLLDVLLCLGAGRIIARNAERLARFLASAPVIGQTTTRILVIGFDAEEVEQHRLGIAAFDQADLTAFVIAQVLIQLPEKLPLGLVSLTQLTTAEKLVPALLDEFPGAIVEGL